MSDRKTSIWIVLARQRSDSKQGNSVEERLSVINKTNK